MENQKTTPAKSTGQLLFISFAVILAVMSVAKYQSLHATYFDLSLFLHYHNNIWHGKWWLIIAGHVQPILFLCSWIFSTFPQELAPIILLTGQNRTMHCFPPPHQVLRFIDGFHSKPKC